MKHRFVSTVADGSTATDVQPGDWNDEHLSQWGGTTASIPEVLARDANAVISSNSSALTTGFSFAVPARALGVNRMLRLNVFGDYSVGSTVTNTFNYFLLHGGANRWGDVSANQAAVQATGVWQVTASVMAMGTSGSRRMWGQMWDSSAAAAGTTGIGDIGAVGAAAMRRVAMFGSSSVFTVTTGVAETIALRFNWAVANSSFSWRKRYAMLELI